MTIRTITHQSPEYALVKDLRDAVLRRPLGLSILNDDLSKDKAAIIFIAEEGAEIIGCVLLQPQEDRQVMRLRAMAVAHRCQGRGIGRKLVIEAEKRAVESRAGIIILHARQVVLPFYEKLGYSAMGAVFTEVGIPHLLMQKKLTA